MRSARRFSTVVPFLIDIGDTTINTNSIVAILFSLADCTFRYTPADHAGLAESDIHLAVVRDGIFFNI